MLFKQANRDEKKNHWQVVESLHTHRWVTSPSSALILMEHVETCLIYLGSTVFIILSFVLMLTV